MALGAWLDAGGGRPVWLITTDVPSRARRLYEALGFRQIGIGPDAPNGLPGLVRLRN